jgi:alpha-beta hydrolase superfamily lysophospholipase
LSPLLVPLNNSGPLAFLDEFLVGLWPSFATELEVDVHSLSRDEEVVAELKNDPLQHNVASVKLQSEVSSYHNRLCLPLRLLQLLSGSKQMHVT